jgi:hypothetical protein
MAKKLSAVAQKFANAAKQKRATAKAAQAVEQNEPVNMLDQSFLSFDDFPPFPDGVLVISPITIYGDLVADVLIYGGNPKITVRFNDQQGTEVQIQHVAACKDLLTYGQLMSAFVTPDGTHDLANLIRQREAQVDAELIRAALSSGDQTHQKQARL